jgi:DNA-binding MarR family transcriptional regulator
MSADVTDLADYRRVVVSLTGDGRTARLQILAFARQGMLLADIADRLGLSEQVVGILLDLKAQPGALSDH